MGCRFAPNWGTRVSEKLFKQHLLKLATYTRRVGIFTGFIRFFCFFFSINARNQYTDLWKCPIKENSQKWLGKSAAGLLHPMLHKCETGLGDARDSLSGPALRDTARLSQRYPLLRTITWPLGCATPPPFLSVYPLESSGYPPPPQKGYLSDIGATPHENKAKWVRYICDAASGGCCATGGVSQKDLWRRLLEIAPFSDTSFPRSAAASQPRGALCHSFGRGASRRAGPKGVSTKGVSMKRSNFPKSRAFYTVASKRNVQKSHWSWLPLLWQPLLSLLRVGAWMARFARIDSQIRANRLILANRFAGVPNWTPFLRIALPGSKKIESQALRRFAQIARALWKYY